MYIKYRILPILLVRKCFQNTKMYELFFQKFYSELIIFSEQQLLSTFLFCYQKLTSKNKRRDRKLFGDLTGQSQILRDSGYVYTTSFKTSSILIERANEKKSDFHSLNLNNMLQYFHTHKLYLPCLHAFDPHYLEYIAFCSSSYKRQSGKHRSSSFRLQLENKKKLMSILHFTVTLQSRNT